MDEPINFGGTLECCCVCGVHGPSCAALVTAVARADEAEKWASTNYERYTQMGSDCAMAQARVQELETEIERLKDEQRAPVRIVAFREFFTGSSAPTGPAVTGRECGTCKYLECKLCFRWPMPLDIPVDRYAKPCGEWAARSVEQIGGTT